jgi:hypothetical protein
MARDGRKKQFRVRVGQTFDMSFSDLTVAKAVRDFELRRIYQ